MDTLFYDGQCPLCSKEIATLRKLETGNLDFADIHVQDTEKALLPESGELLRRLHLRTGDGEWLIGLHATVRAWSHTRLGFLFKPLLWPLVYPLANRIYSSWADRRYRRKYDCNACRIGS